MAKVPPKTALSLQVRKHTDVLFTLLIDFLLWCQDIQKTAVDFSNCYLSTNALFQGFDSKINMLVTVLLLSATCYVVWSVCRRACGHCMTLVQRFGGPSLEI